MCYNVDANERRIDMQENVCKKYNITLKELQEGVNQYSDLATGKFAGDIDVLLAILDLLCNGDITGTAK